jgi:hypothetical protein
MQHDFTISRNFHVLTTLADTAHPHMVDMGWASKDSWHGCVVGGLFENAVCIQGSWDVVLHDPAAYASLVAFTQGPCVRISSLWKERDSAL